MKRTARANLAQETISILGAGTYISASGNAVDIRADLDASVGASRTIRPEEWRDLMAAVRARPLRDGVGRVEVAAETTLAALHRVAVLEESAAVTALNFASAKNPGGGFLGGSQAQEESLARSSGLYSTLVPQSDYYNSNRSHRSLLYTDHAILSPFVPVFRDDTGVLIDRPYTATFITMPAANLGAMNAGSTDRARVPEIMRHRIDCLCALAASTGSRHLILGAWGCGVFRNDPDLIARLFAESLTGSGSWRSYFDRIVFAVFDATEPAVNRPPFELHLSKL